MINEIVGALIGGSLPTFRSREIPEGEKRTPNFYFQVIHPDAMNAGASAKGRNQAENIKAVIADILGHGNEGCMLPGQIEAEAAAKTAEAGGLLFTEAEIGEFNQFSEECGLPTWELNDLKSA